MVPEVKRRLPPSGGVLRMKGASSVASDTGRHGDLVSRPCAWLVFSMTFLLSRGNPRNKLRVPAACAIGTCALLMTGFALFPPGAAQFLLVALGGLVMTASVGPVAAVAIDVVHRGLRASAASMVALVQNIFGLAAGPFVAGTLSDAYGLQVSLAVVPLMSLLAAAAFLRGARTYERDLETADSAPLPADAMTSVAAA